MAIVMPYWDERSAAMSARYPQIRTDQYHIDILTKDYRAAATIDLEHDAADAYRKVLAPLLALWGAKGTVGQLYDVLAAWRVKAGDVRGRALDSGHGLHEEVPVATLADLLWFLTA